MKKQGILNSQIASVLAQLGHTDCIVISDCGLPIPFHVLRIDLALKQGNPAFCTVLDIVLEDMYVERAVFATECQHHNPAVLQRAQSLSAAHITVDYTAHETFKQLTHHAKAVIRTGEASPYANVILYSGVPF